MSEKGIDVSSYQGIIDWKKVKAAGVQFAILKVIRKDLNPDKKFESNWSGCEAAGMTIQGVYNYSYATTVEKAKTDAKKVVSILGKDRHPMVWLDVEDSVQKNLGQKLIDIIKAYGEVIKYAGMTFGVYTGKSFYESYIKKYQEQVKDIPFWIARYPSSKEMTISSNPAANYKPDVHPIMYGWQYSSKGKVEGVSGNVDMNEWYAEVEADVSEKDDSGSYSYNDFLKDSAKVWKTLDKVDMIKKSVTISVSSNRTHNIVTPLERYMKSLGYYTGKIEEDEGKTPLFGNGMKKAIKLYQEHVVKAEEKYRDGILTARAATWKSLYI